MAYVFQPHIGWTVANSEGIEHSQGLLKGVGEVATQPQSFVQQLHLLLPVLLK